MAAAEEKTSKNTKSTSLNVRILDKEYQVHSPANAQQALLNSAHLLDERMRDIRSSGRVIGTERIAVMAALNIAYELLQMRGGTDQGDMLTQERVRDIRERIDAVLQRATEAQAARSLEPGTAASSAISSDDEPPPAAKTRPTEH